MLDFLEALPLVLDRGVVLEVEVGLGVLDMILAEHFDDSRRDRDGDTAVEVGWVDGDQTEVDDLRVLDRLQKADQRAGGESAARFLYRLADRREAYADTDGLIVFVEDDRDVLRVDDQLERFDDLFLHRLGKGDGAVKMLVALVDQIEEIVAVFVDKIADVLRLAEVQVITLHDEIRHLLDGGVVVGGRDHALRPVDLLLKAQRFDQLGIIIVVILFLKGRDTVKALDQQPLALEIGESQRAAERVHAFILRPLFYSAEQRGGDFLAVDRVEAGEANALLVVLLIGRFLDDALDCRPTGFSPSKAR